MAYKHNALLFPFACFASLCACLNVVIGDKTASIDRRDYGAIIAQLATLSAKVEELEAQSDALKAERELQEQNRAFFPYRNETGSTYVRWGRKTCSAKATLVYSGVAGGKIWSETGGGTNRLCLSLSPQFDDVVPPTHPQYGGLFARIYGAEYQYIGSLHDHDVPCAVCRVPQATTLMIPGTLTCPHGWTTQYTGHLAGEKHDHPVGSEYVCLDYNPEPTNSGIFDHNGNLFYYVATVCGSLPCPPYASDKVLTCVVCTS